MGARNVFLNMKGPTRNFILAKRGGDMKFDGQNYKDEKCSRNLAIGSLFLFIVALQMTLF